MSQQMHYPAVAVSVMYKPSLAEGLAEVCVPLGRANPGDILAVVQDLRYAHQTITRPAIHRFIVLSDVPGVAHPKPVHFADLRDDLKPATALAVMKMQEEWAPFGNGTIAGVHYGWCPAGEEIHTTIYMLPRLALLTVEEYKSEIFDVRYYEEEREQAHLDDAICIFAEARSSNHDALAAQHEMDEACAIFSAICPITDEVGEVLHLPAPLVANIKRPT